MITNQFTTQPFAPKQWERTEDGFLRVKARVLAERVMPYAVCELAGFELPSELAACEVVNMLVDRSVMSTGDSFRTLESAQVTAPEHIWVTPDNDHDSKGNAVGAPQMDGPYLVIDLLVTDPAAIADIEAGHLGEISAGYHADTIFEAGDFEGTPYQAKQTKLRFNHIAIIPPGTGRAGSDVRIINQKEGDKSMSDLKLVRVQLRNTKRFVNVDEEGATAIAAEESAAAETEAASGKKLEALMVEAEEAKAAAAAANAELETLKGELSVYKDKLDQLLSEEAIEHAAMGMVEEAGEAEEIIENAAICNEKGEEDGIEKMTLKNSLKGLYGTQLHNQVLTAIGVKTENMSPEALRGAFKAQHQITNAMKGKRSVAGTRMMNQNLPQGAVEVKHQIQRTGKERMGFKK